MTRKQAIERTETCQECGQSFRPRPVRTTTKQLYCSNKCKMKNYWRRRLAKEVA